MLFNSVEFWLFFAVTLVIHALLPHRYRWALLLVASYVFYMWWNAGYAVLIALSTVVDYAAGRAIHSASTTRAKKLALWASLVSNIGMLFTFKYWGFFHESMAAILLPFGVSYEVPSLDVLLPVGISFYTFQTLSYTIDIYRGTLTPERHLGKFALFVSFFPQLVAGPIERARHLLPQISTPKRFDPEALIQGLQLAAWGLFKKVVIADRLALYVDPVYDHPDAYSGPTLLLATYAFAFQIYCDFSGYSDIAIGTARALGFDLMVNFERPYFASSIRDFWRRWHISLSAWLRDYLYIPLGGNRGSAWFTYRNLMLTMLLGGLWHGASWNFVIWGGLQGGMLSVSRMTLDARDRLSERVGVPRWLRDAVRVILTFHLVCLSWVFFRSSTLDDAMVVLGGVIRPWSALFVDVPTFAHGALGVTVLVAVEVAQSRYGSLRRVVESWPRPARWLLLYGLLLSIVIFGVESESQFIYFQF